MAVAIAPNIRIVNTRRLTLPDSFEELGGADVAVFVTAWVEACAFIVVEEVDEKAI